MNEPELIKRCKQGDRRAQKDLYGLFADPMYRVVFRYLKSSADSEDVLMMAFAKVFANIGRFDNRGQGSLDGWVRKVVVNEALMWLRRRHNFHMTETLEPGQEHVDLAAFSDLPAEEIGKLIGELPPGYRTVFNLYVVEGFDHKEIADMLGITDSTSRTQLFKAKTLLKKMLTREGFQYGT